jgi:hypothetical protein
MNLRVRKSDINKFLRGVESQEFTLTKTMSKALLLTSVNSELKLESVTKQSPSNGQVLIEHIAVAQNPLDVYQKSKLLN